MALLFAAGLRDFVAVRDVFAAAGADVITAHVEAGPHVHRTLQAIRADFGGVGKFLKENIFQRSDKGPSLHVSGIFKHVEDTATSTGVFHAVSVTDSRTRHFEEVPEEIVQINRPPATYELSEHTAALRFPTEKKRLTGAS